MILAEERWDRAPGSDRNRVRL